MRRGGNKKNNDNQNSNSIDLSDAVDQYENEQVINSNDAVANIPTTSRTIMPPNIRRKSFYPENPPTDTGSSSDSVVSPQKIRRGVSKIVLSLLSENIEIYLTPEYFCLVLFSVLLSKICGGCLQKDDW